MYEVDFYLIYVAPSACCVSNKFHYASCASEEKSMQTIIETSDADETFEVGRKLGILAKPGDIYALNGDLGVGKTVFAKGIASGLGIAEHVGSPTFTIVQAYEGGRIPLYHFDVYRIGDASAMYEIGYEDCFFGDGVSIIEWAELIDEIIPADAKHIIIEKNPEKGFEYRKIICDFEV